MTVPRGRHPGLVGIQPISDVTPCVRCRKRAGFYFWVRPARELVDDLTQTDVTLPAQALRRSSDLGIKSYRCPRDIIVMSQIHKSRITDAANAL